MKLICLFLVFVGIQLNDKTQAQIVTGANAPFGSEASTNDIDEIQKQLQQLLDQEAKLNMLKQKLLQKLETSQPKESTTRPPIPGTRFPTVPSRNRISTSSSSSASTQVTSTVKPNIPIPRTPLTEKVQFVKSKSSGPEFPFMEVNVESGGIFIKRVATN